MRLTLPLALLTALLASRAAFTDVTVLAARPGDPKDLVPSAWTAFATAVNNSGTAVGIFTPTEEGDVQKGFKGGSTLPSFGSTGVTVFGITPGGLALGRFFKSGDNHPFRGTKELKKVGDGGATAVDGNNAGVTCGSCVTVNGNTSFETPCAWGPDGKGAVLAPGTIGRGSGINRQGQIVGISSSRPAFWSSKDATARNLPVPAGTISGEATDINDHSIIVGYVFTTGGTRACRWENFVLQDLGLGVASAINNNGDIVGTLNGVAAMRDSSGTVWDLNCMLPAGTKWGLGGPSDINDSRQMVGGGSNGNIRPPGRQGRRAYLFKFNGAVNCPPTGGAGQVLVFGRVRYEKIPVTNSGLKLTQKTPTAAAAVLVEAVDAGNAAVSSTFTDNGGNYSLSVPSAAGTLRIRVAAQTTNGTQVVNDDPTPALYSITGPSFSVPATGSVTQNLLATDSTRANGPFNILASINRANDFIRTADPSTVFPSITVRWSVTRSATTAFDHHNNTAFINGDRSIDSDEFDDLVLNHEYGHYLSHLFSRDTSPGGDHNDTYREDARLAWSEGWATFFSCASNTTNLYRDSLGPNGNRVFQIDLEKNSRAHNVPGYWSEHSVGSALWDLTDSRNDAGDTVTVPWPEIWGAFVDLKTDDAYVYLMDFCERLNASDPATGVPMQNILAERNELYSPGVDPPVPDPFPQPIASGVPVTDTADSVTVGQRNVFDASRFYEFRLAAPGQVTIDLQITGPAIAGQPADLDLFLLDQDGNQLAKSDTTDPAGGSERIPATGSMNLNAGYYVIEVRSWFRDNSGTLTTNAGNYTLTAGY